MMTAEATALVRRDAPVLVDNVMAVYEAAVASDAEIVYLSTSDEWGVRRFFYRNSPGRVINVGIHT